MERIAEAALEVRCVEWVDSSGGSRWTALDEIAVEAPDRCYSVGYVLKDTVDQLTLVQSLAPRVDQQQHQQHGDNYIVIPKFAIVKQRTLRKAR